MRSVQIFTAGSAVISVSIALNALSMHATCTAVFVAVAAIASFCLSSIRTLGRISWLAWVGVSCIIVAGTIFTTFFFASGEGPNIGL